MGSIASLSDLVNRLTGGNSGTPENIWFFKSFTMSGTADSWVTGLLYDAWRYEGFPGAGATPTTVAAPTSATAGAIPFTNPGGGREKWLVSATYMPGSAGVDVISGIIYDRLLHIGGLSGTTITAQTVGGSLTRNTGGVGNQIWAVIHTLVGTTPRTITASYTNQSGTSGRTTQAVTFGGSTSNWGNDVNQIIPLPLQAGDTGVQAVASVTLSASTGTAGDFGIIVARPLVFLIPASRGVAGRDFTVGPGGMPEIDTDACLALAFLAGTTNEVFQMGVLSTVEA